jgi:uncharacterized protein (TIGR02147 family)
MSTVKPKSPDADKVAKLPEVFGYLDHRDFLKDWFETKRTLSKAFSYRTFARKAGFASHAFLSEVIQGRRNLSEDSAEKCLPALGLAGEAAKYFQLLVRYGQETHLEKRRDFLSELLRLQATRAIERVTGGQSEYFTHWLNVAVREVAVFSKMESAKAMAGFFQPTASVAEVEKSLALLERLELIKRKVGGGWDYSFPRLTPGDVAPEIVRSLKRQMILLAQDRLSQPESPDTHVSSVTVSVSRHRLSKVREILERTRREILAETATDEDSADQVLQINFQMFPLTSSLERYRSEHA